jgi:hypothetical protein
MSFLRHGKSIDPMWDWKTPGQELGPAPALIDLDEFRLAIPRRDALQQGPPPLPQPGAACSKLGSSVEHFSSNGKLSLNWLSHPRGQAQFVFYVLRTSERYRANAIRALAIRFGMHYLGNALPKSLKLEGPPTGSTSPTRALEKYSHLLDIHQLPFIAAVS